MDAPHGPITIPRSLQVRLPAEVARAMNWVGGETEVYVVRSTDDAESVLLTTKEAVARRYAAGRDAELSPG